MYERKDQYYRKAQAAGYRSRAAFKLLELSRRYRVIRKGDRVVDLGAWPGSWLQVAAEMATPTGVVVGVDVRALDAEVRGAQFVLGDVCDPEIRRRVREAAGGPVDVVLSDLAPKLTGIRDRDQARIEELAEVAMEFAEETLRPGGRFVMKSFAGPANSAWLGRLRPRFATVKLTRPEATRGGSSELYLVAIDFRALPGR